MTDHRYLCILYKIYADSSTSTCVFVRMCVLFYELCKQNGYNNASQNCDYTVYVPGTIINGW